MNLEKIKPLKDKQELMKTEQFEGQGFIYTSICFVEIVVGAKVTWRMEWAPKFLIFLY